jgi:maleate isomerase
VVALKEYSGWRARIGLIYMASSTVMEPEFYAMSPDGVATCTARTHLSKVTVEGVGKMMASDDLERCTSFLANADLHVIVYGGTSATFLHGLPWDEKIKARMAAVSKGIPVTTTSSASLAALRAVGATRISFVAPYVPEIVERGRKFFSECGFKVLSADGMNIDDDHAIGFVPIERVYEFSRKSADPKADAVFISCTNLLSVGAIAALEEDLGIPVVSAVQASFWQALRMAGVQDRVQGFGRLFDA